MNKLFVFLTILVTLGSQFIHPEGDTWLPISYGTYVICGFLLVLSLFCKLKNRKKLAKTMIETVVIFFVEYAVITAIAYLRIVDILIEEGPLYIGATIVAALIFKYIVSVGFNET